MNITKTFRPIAYLFFTGVILLGALSLSACSQKPGQETEAEIETEKRYGLIVDGYIIEEAGFTQEAWETFGGKIIVESQNQLRSVLDPSYKSYTTLCNRYGDQFFEEKNLAISGVGVANCNEQTIYLISIQSENSVEQKYLHYIPEVLSPVVRDDLLISEVSKKVDTIVVKEECLYEEPFYLR